MHCYISGAGSHSTLVSPLAGLNLDAFHPSRTTYALGPYASRFYQHPQYLSNPYQYAWPGPSQPKAPQPVFSHVSNWSWPWAPSMNSYTDPLPQLTYNPFAIPQCNYADMSSIPAPSSPTVTSASGSPSLASQRVPLLAPKPLPYHSPKFLQFELPDEDEDLSHPPYIRPTKRKRGEDDEGRPEEGPTKRRASERRVAPSRVQTAVHAKFSPEYTTSPLTINRTSSRPMLRISLSVISVLCYQPCTSSTFLMGCSGSPARLETRRVICTNADAGISREATDGRQRVAL
ncbi:hypothetical protein OE88DRAFT_1642409 [Heliocybe sulcata]|uniref:Uncharacterized protein n=1 Tax=Heliocybe sulcata TaxID=5364 RepID=A0A5C3ND11_9AGAM|nr:hypothetical protein OE88DRAFT_1642409 [Heliocybe sulcata]